MIDYIGNLSKSFLQLTHWSGLADPLMSHLSAKLQLLSQSDHTLCVVCGGSAVSVMCGVESCAQ